MMREGTRAEAVREFIRTMAAVPARVACVVFAALLVVGCTSTSHTGPSGEPSKPAVQKVVLHPRGVADVAARNAA